MSTWLTCQYHSCKLSLRTGSWRSKRWANIRREAPGKWSLHAFSQIANVCAQILDAKRWLVDYNYSWRNLSFHFRYRQKSKWRKGEKWFFERLEGIYQVIWNWSPNSVMQWSIFSTTMMCSPFFLQDMAKAIIFNSLLLLLRLKGKSHRLYVLVVCPLKTII